MCASLSLAAPFGSCWPLAPRPRFTRRPSKPRRLDLPCVNERRSRVSLVPLLFLPNIQGDRLSRSLCPQTGGINPRKPRKQEEAYFLQRSAAASRIDKLTSHLERRDEGKGQERAAKERRASGERASPNAKRREEKRREEKRREEKRRRVMKE